MSRVDPEKLRDYSRNVFQNLMGATVSGMIYLGDRLGLYKALAGGAARTSQELARQTGLDERWVREWLQGQGAARLLEYEGDGRFRLSPEAEVVLADESHPAFGAGSFSHLPQQMAVLEQLPESFRTGLGLPYDALGPEGATGVERGFAPWYRTQLVRVALPKLPGVVAALEAGARVADVGCGGGVALIEMARAYPKSEFHGYDISLHALARARENLASEDLGNVSFHHAEREPLPDDARFAFVTTFDCLHDMTDPKGIMHAIRRAVAPDGVWLIADIKAAPTYEENVERNPMAAMMYGFSVMSCMSSALSEAGGAGLGTLGFHEALAEQWSREAGFTRFETLDFGHPINAFYCVRP